MTPCEPVFSVQYSVFSVQELHTEYRILLTDWSLEFHNILGL